MKYGSVDSLKVSDRCGCRPNARQIRDTDDCEKPFSFAIDCVDQCVAFFGVDSSVLLTTAATCSSVTVLGATGTWHVTQTGDWIIGGRRFA
jgi:hypothetical protein